MENMDPPESRRVNDTPLASMSMCSFIVAAPIAISVSWNWPEIKTEIASVNKQFEAIVVLTVKSRDIRCIRAKGIVLPA